MEELKRMCALHTDAYAFIQYTHIPQHIHILQAYGAKYLYYVSVPSSPCICSMCLCRISVVCVCAFSRIYLYAIFLRRRCVCTSLSVHTDLNHLRSHRPLSLFVSLRFCKQIHMYTHTYTHDTLHTYK